MEREKVEQIKGFILHGNLAGMRLPAFQTQLILINGREFKEIEFSLSQPLGLLFRPHLKCVQ